MTTVTQLPARRVPRDTFPIRLAIVRAEMGWNYDQAETATGISSESWRTWEKGKRRCANVEGISRKLSEVTGFSYEWLMIGGPLAPQVPDPTGTAASTGSSDTVGIRPTNPCLLGGSVTLGPWAPRVPTIIRHRSAA